MVSNVRSSDDWNIEGVEWQLLQINHSGLPSCYTVYTMYSPIADGQTGRGTADWVASPW